MIHIVKGFCVVNKAEIDVFLELSCFSDNPVDVDNLISVYSAFSKTSLKIWNFTVHVLLKPGLENFKHYLIANIRWIMENAREFQQNIYFCFIDYAKAFGCVDHNKLVENSERDGNVRPSYLPLEKSVCRSGSNS